MVQKATELGVARLQPVLTRRTIAARVNLERMRANAIEAAEQCGVLRVPRVGSTRSSKPCSQAGIRCARSCSATRPPTVASPLAALAALEGRPLAVLIGPEGGFDA